MVHVRPFFQRNLMTPWPMVMELVYYIPVAVRPRTLDVGMILREIIMIVFQNFYVCFGPENLSR